jgi:tetratricopeptide (TPR) repeat protein
LLLEHGPHVQRLGDAIVTARYYHALATVRILMGEHDLADQAALRALREASACGDGLTMGEAHQALALVRFWSGQYAAASEHARESASLLAGVGEPYDVGTSHWVGALSHMFVGEFRQALDAVAALEAVGLDAGEPRLVSNALWTRGGVHAWCGEGEAAVEACRRALELAPDPVTAASATGFLGFALLEQGEAGPALRALEDAVLQFARFGMPHAQGGFMSWLAEAHLLARDPDAARRVALEGLDISRRVISPHGVGGAQQVLGKIAQATGALEEAERWYREALGTFADCGARFEVGRTRLALAGLAGEVGDHDGAAAHLAEARRVFSLLHVSRYEERACALAGRLGLGPSRG